MYPSIAHRTRTILQLVGSHAFDATIAIGIAMLVVGASGCTSCASESPAAPRAVARVEVSLTLMEAQALCASYPGKNLIVGTDGDDTLDGTNKDDCIVAGNGNDRVHAGNGADVVISGDGADEVWGDNGDDILLLGAGNDRAYGGNGNDQLNGEAGADALQGESGDDVLLLGPGNDRGVGGNGNDEIRGDDGADVVDGQNGTDSIFGDGCHDRVATSSGGDSISGGDGIDVCTGTSCELASSTPTCSVDGNCATEQRCAPESGVCVPTGTESCAYETSPPLDGGICTPLSQIDATCNAIDDDCDGEFDEDYVPQNLECGVGACARTQSTTCVNGTVTGTCIPGAPSTSDATCDAVDDDCDGTVDESFGSQVSQCGVGACQVTGATQCVDGTIEPGCTAGVPAPSDATCDRVDDDCDGTADEDVAPQMISCGVGACSATGTRQCVDGVLVDSCTPGSPTTSDTVCNGIDDDCDLRIDEEYLILTTSCGVGACAAEGKTSCVSGAVQNSCQPGTGAPSDATCNAIDDDCDGAADEDVTPVSVQCGVGACARNGAVQCVLGQPQNTCAPGQPLGPDTSCNAVDDDCDGRHDEGYVPQSITCGVGACAATGTTVCTAGQESESCTPGTGGSQDTVCNGLDDDCDSDVDEEFSPQPSTCGVGACANTGELECVQGMVTDDCAPRLPLPADDTCNGLDDDCNGAVDEDYVSVGTSCGLGTCARTGAMLCESGTTVDSCVPGLPASDDASCNGEDDDCDGSIDEHYAPVQVSCGVGACTATGTTACVDGQMTNSCVAGMGAQSDSICNGIDDDCDEAIDEDVVPAATSCGVGGCASSGVRTCANGGLMDTCQPGAAAPSDVTCDSVDEDCDTRTDEDYEAQTTFCGIGMCAAVGTTSCVNGAIVDSCAPHPPAPSDDACDTRDDDCDGTTDEGFTGVDTMCGIGACVSSGRTVCLDGTIADTCTPGSAGLDDATCNGVDDDCGGAEDEDYAPVSTQCGIGVCARTGQLLCVEGALQDSCQPGTGVALDATCDAFDDDCNGAVDEDYLPQQTQCGTGACTANGMTSCRSGAVLDSCVTGTPSMVDAVCDERDEDCDGLFDENYAPQPIQCGVGACIATGQQLCVGGVLTPQCTPSTPGTTQDASCDAVDQDCDGQLDEEYAVTSTTCGSGACMGIGDLRCVGGVEQDTCQLRASCEANCHDAADDDADGFVDCRDADCAGSCEIYCADGADDDGDSDVDCADADCTGQTGCVPEICGNSLDDDADGLVDCADLPDCANAAACPPIPPPAEEVAPPLAPGAANRMVDRVEFLFEGPDPVQRGVTPGTIQEETVGLITGAVALADGRPLPGVRVTILDHPEFGLTHTDAQGRFHLVLNGGGLMTVEFELAGYIAAQRQVEVPWQRSATAADVVMVPRSPVVSTIDVSGAATDYQIGAARVESDADGERRAVIAFPPGVAAQVLDATGVPVNVASLNLRVTELTVGPRGRDAMPAELPPSSGYTYAVDITPDEAQGIKVDGKDTLLSAPVSFYLDNFLSFPAGTLVPTGYYDDTAAVWKAIDSGRVIDVWGKPMVSRSSIRTATAMRTTQRYC